MDAIVRTGHGKGDVGVEAVDRADPSVGEVSIRQVAAGVCGSDVGAYLGKPEYEFMDVPTVLGHECAGVVESVGAGVARVEPGDRVVLQPGDPCGGCFQCLSGEPNNCPEREPAVDAGGFAPYNVVAAERVLPVPDGVPIERAALAEPLAVTSRAVLRKGDVSAGNSVLVQGPGPMGALSALIADHAGGDVTVTGLADDEPRLARLESTGIEMAVVGPGGTTPRALVEDLDRNGFDLTIDATGVATGVESAIEVTRDGGDVVVLGIASGDVALDAAALVREEIDLRTSHGSVPEDFLTALSLLEGGLPVGELIDREYSPRTPAAAFDAFAAGETIKPVFELAALRGE
jgi:L-iditol 2-dehydrogenase